MPETAHMKTDNQLLMNLLILHVEHSVEHIDMILIKEKK